MLASNSRNASLLNQPVKVLRLFIGLTAVSLVAFAFLMTPKAQAANYNYSNMLMDDVVMRASTTMTASDIQTFLAQKGSGLATFSDIENCGPTSGSHYSYYATYYSCGQWRSAAQIIADAGRAYGINPQVLLATMQKEQSLITTPNPTASQLNFAMGYGCPDSGSCSYPGFFNQLDNAAWQFRTYMELGSGNNWWGYSPASYPCNGGSRYYSAALKAGNYIMFKDDNGVVYNAFTIPNIATGGLYCYTPHVYNNPNGLFGLPVYGNTGQYYTGSYNFVYYFNRWFDPSSWLQNSITMRTIAQPDTSPARGQTVTYTVSFTSSLSENITLDAIGIVGRAGNVQSGPNRDFGWQGPVTLQPGVTQNFTFTTTIQDTGMVYAWPAISYQGGYVHYNNWGVAMNAHLPSLSLTAPLSSTVNSPVAGQTATLSATIKNNEDQPLRLDSVGIPVRYYGNYNYDTGWAASPITLNPGQTTSVSGNLTFDKPGPYSAWVSVLIAGRYTTLSDPLNFNVSSVSPNFTLTYLETPNPSPSIGEDVRVKFKLKNNLGVGITLDAVGIVGRYDNPYTGANRDFGWVGPETFTAGQEKSYTTFVSNVSELKNFYAWVALRYQNSYFHYNNWGFMMTPHMPNLTLSGPLTVNGGTPPTLGQTVTVTATVKNNEAQPIKYSALGIPARYYGPYNYDAVWQGAGTLAASGQANDSVALSGTIKFDKPGPYTVWTSINIGGRYITIGNPQTINL